MAIATAPAETLDTVKPELDLITSIGHEKPNKPLKERPIKSETLKPKTLSRENIIKQIDKWVEDQL